MNATNGSNSRAEKTPLIVDSPLAKAKLLLPPNALNTPEENFILMEI